MANFNEHVLEMSIMELFKDEKCTYLTGEKMHKEYTNFLTYNYQLPFYYFANIMRLR